MQNQNNLFAVKLLNY